MNDLHEQIRRFIDSGATPVSVDEIVAGSTHIESPPSFRRNRRLGRGVLVASAVAAIAAVIVTSVAGMVTVPGANDAGVAPASAATFLKAAAVQASNQKALTPKAGQYLYTATILGATFGERIPPRKVFYYDADELVQKWTSPWTTGHVTLQVVGRPRFISAADRATWVADGSKPLGSGSVGEGAPSYYDVSGLPTTASAMVSYFRSQRGIPAESWYGSLRDWEYDTALQFLQSGASSAQRAALLKFIATLPGVRLDGRATSVATGESGSVIELPLTRPGWAEEAIFNQMSSRLIEIRYVITSLPQTTTTIKFLQQAPLFVGEIESYSDFLFAGVTRSHSSYSLPAGTPQFPRAWPFGSLREPLPGWLGSK